MKAKMNESEYTTVVCHLCNQEWQIPNKLVPKLILPYECSYCTYEYNKMKSRSRVVED